MNLKYKLAEFIGTVGYVGYLPIAPGTWGSLAALIAWYILKPMISDPLFLLITGAIFFAGVAASEILVEAWEDGDPKAVVVDEWVGMWIALYLAPHTLVWGLVAFLLFRFFDILKPGPIQLMDDLHSAIGVMMDDVVAGIFALLLTQSLLYFFI
ncbi:MAG: phosphatidylglycerophosphatase A [Candidatus Marinimicrobia bacterium]|jgi:phosphatidylglycerophosphatase A|nr:phosphatidylglycerophosphatase A [Candidatus Neomarinimicrobiota bacterium]MBT6796419.1 phosphatidylglycerophosphatase A [Candidatus Neomarinimicrobiota bacterium]MBT6866090.1 phosphatidylglycerophosphatase A [Candidatus Neomarinimicrobiota bacterium]MBT7945120.1 phosphatidylglycerophosphatase A [Candidatus Neomarinimicrobiota bacterium]|tara:strand:- start:989 stop:1450 length:462 start_codon:yes stop_codon:yes gene_type:complete